MITQIDVTSVETSFCNASNNSWCYGMFVDKRKLHFNVTDDVQSGFYFMFLFELHESPVKCTEIELMRFIHEIT